MVSAPRWAVRDWLTVPGACWEGDTEWIPGAGHLVDATRAATLDAAVAAAAAAAVATAAASSAAAAAAAGDKRKRGSSDDEEEGGSACSIM